LENDCRNLCQAARMAPMEDQNSELKPSKHTT